MAVDKPTLYHELSSGEVKYLEQESVLAVAEESTVKCDRFSYRSIQAGDILGCTKRWGKLSGHTFQGTYEGVVQGRKASVYSTMSKPHCVARNKMQMPFEELVSTLQPCSDQCQAALKILDLTEELKKMIDQETRRFKLAGSQLLRNCFTADDQTAKIRLQMSLVDCFCKLATIATSTDPGHRQFAADLEHYVTSDSEKPHYSDITISQLPSSSDDNPRCTSQNEKLCVVVELMFSGLESRHKVKFQKAFSQLMHSAALAFNAKQWDQQLCCCLGSLTHWHVFLLRVVRDPERDCHPFQISHYNEFALHKEPFDWDTCGSQFVDMYKTLFEHLLAYLLG